MGMKVHASGVNFAAVTKSDTTPVTCTALYIGGAGDVTLAQSVGGTAVAFTGLSAGSILPVALKNGTVNAATTATGIVKLDW